MKLKGKVVVVTGGATGIGRAMCRRFAVEGARAVVVADLNGEGAQAVAREIGGLALTANVGCEEDIRQLVETTLKRYGQIDLFCSNAGISIGGGSEAPNDGWQRIWEVNVMAHVYAARAVLPSMIERGEGYLLQTASAAGLLTALSTAPYSVTKHAAVSFAEWLSISHAHQGIKVSCLCPQGVRTDMLSNSKGFGAMLLEGSLAPEEVADKVVEGLEAEEFLILPHPEVKGYFQKKASDYDRWLQGMRRLHDSIC